MKIFKTTPHNFPYEGAATPLLVPAKNKKSAGKKGKKEWEKGDPFFKNNPPEIKAEEVKIEGYEIILRKKEVK